jgi:plastocyanin
MNSASPHEQPRTAVTGRGLAVAAGVAVLALAGWAFWPIARAPGLGSNEYRIVMDDYSFSPSRLTWQPGETVTVTILNQSSSRPGKPHEIMFGRLALREPGPFGSIQGDGFEDQLLDRATVDLLAGERVSMVMAETARLTGVDPMSLMGPDMDMSGDTMRMGMDFMAVIDPGGSLSFAFTVPDQTGEWEFGCFQQDGQHYLNGMKGVLTVAR